MISKSMIALTATLTATSEQPPVSQPQAGTVFALIDENEWCPGGSVYLDLRTGAFMLHPRLARPACADPAAQTSVEHGMLGSVELQRLRLAFAEARRAGLRREPCEFVVSNGGPQALVIIAPGASASAPENDGCWSAAASALHRQLYEVFGRQRHPHE